MITIELPIGKSRYKITCEDGREEELLQLASIINERINKLSIKFKNSDEKTLLAITTLIIEEELQSKNDLEIEEDEIAEQTNKFNEQDLYDAISENMENIADYIEKLIKKIQNY